MISERRQIADSPSLSATSIKVMETRFILNEHRNKLIVDVT
jgi:hypothetical protein